MNILIFGGSGFLGEQLAYKLYNSGHNVTIFDKNKKKTLPNKIKFISGDILNKKEVEKAVKKKILFLTLLHYQILRKVFTIHLTQLKLT